MLVVVIVVALNTTVVHKIIIRKSESFLVGASSPFGSPGTPTSDSSSLQTVAHFCLRYTCPTVPLVSTGEVGREDHDNNVARPAGFQESDCGGDCALSRKRDWSRGPRARLRV